MSIASDLRAFLLEDSTLAGLVSERIYPDVLPQNPTLPAITFGWAGGMRFHHLTGASGLSGPRIQFDCWATTYLGAEAVYEALRLALDGFQGDIGGSPPTQRIQGAFSASEWSGYEAGAEQGTGSGVGVYRHSADFMVYYEEGT